MKLNVTYKDGEKDGLSDLRDQSDFPMDLPGGKYVLTFRHAMEESVPTEAKAKWVPNPDPTPVDDPTAPTPPADGNG
jgi:hypothetical protein